MWQFIVQVIKFDGNPNDVSIVVSSLSWLVWTQSERQEYNLVWHDL